MGSALSKSPWRPERAQQHGNSALRDQGDVALLDVSADEESSLTSLQEQSSQQELQPAASHRGDSEALTVTYPYLQTPEATQTTPVSDEIIERKGSQLGARLGPTSGKLFATEASRSRSEFQEARTSHRPTTEPKHLPEAHTGLVETEEANALSVHSARSSSRAFSRSPSSNLSSQPSDPSASRQQSQYDSPEAEQEVDEIMGSVSRRSRPRRKAKPHISSPRDSPSQTRMQKCGQETSEDGSSILNTGRTFRERSPPSSHLQHANTTVHTNIAHKDVAPRVDAFLHSLRTHSCERESHALLSLFQRSFHDTASRELLYALVATQQPHFNPEFTADLTTGQKRAWEALVSTADVTTGREAVVVLPCDPRRPSTPADTAQDEVKRLRDGAEHGYKPTSIPGSTAKKRKRGEPEPATEASRESSRKSSINGGEQPRDENDAGDVQQLITGIDSVPEHFSDLGEDALNAESSSFAPSCSDKDNDFPKKQDESNAVIAVPEERRRKKVRRGRRGKHKKRRGLPVGPAPSKTTSIMSGDELRTHVKTKMNVDVKMDHQRSAYGVAKDGVDEQNRPGNSEMFPEIPGSVLDNLTKSDGGAVPETEVTRKIDTDMDVDGGIPLMTNDFEKKKEKKPPAKLFTGANGPVYSRNLLAMDALS